VPCISEVRPAALRRLHYADAHLEDLAGDGLSDFGLHTAELSRMLEGDAEGTANAIRDHLARARDTKLKLFS
jgi:DNA-binding GntR family transcriptional regulator